MILTLKDVKSDAMKATEVGDFVITYNYTIETEETVYEVKTFHRKENNPNFVVQNNLFLSHNKVAALEKYEETVESFK